MYFPLHENKDGSFQELAHSSDVKFGQLSILKINPKSVRGGHYHTHKEEWFCCVRGQCIMELVNVKDMEQSSSIVLDGSHSEFILVKPFEAHTLTNLGSEECEVLIIVSEAYNPENTDTFELYVHELMQALVE